MSSVAAEDTEESASKPKSGSGAPGAPAIEVQEADDDDWDLPDETTAALPPVAASAPPAPTQDTEADEAEGDASSDPPEARKSSIPAAGSVPPGSDPAATVRLGKPRVDAAALAALAASAGLGDEPSTPLAPRIVNLPDDRPPDSVHTRRTMPPPGAEAMPPSVAAQRFQSKQKTLQFVPISAEDEDSKPGASDEPAKEVAPGRSDVEAALAAIERAVLGEAAGSDPGIDPGRPTVVNPEPAASPPSEPPPARVIPPPVATPIARIRPAPIATPQARVAVFDPKRNRPLPGPPADAPDVVAEALEPHLAWLGADRRPHLFKHLLCGEYGEVLRFLRQERERLPRVINIPKAMTIVEQAECSRLLHELGATSSEVVVLSDAGASDDSPRATLLRLARTTPTLAELLSSSPLPRLRTLGILRDLVEEESLALRQPARSITLGGFGRGGLTEPSKRSPSRMPEESAPRRVDADRADDEDWTEGLDLLARARAEVAERRSQRPGAPDDRPSRPRESRPSDSLPPSSRSGGEDPSSRRLRDELAAELARLDDLDGRGPRTSLRPPRIEPLITERAASIAPAGAEAPPPARYRTESPPARAQWLTLPLAIAALVVSTVTLTVLVMRPAATPPPQPIVLPAPADRAPTPAPADTSAPTTTPTAAPAMPAEAPTVRLDIDLKPSYGRVYLDGVILTHPVRQSLPRDGAVHELRFEAGGHKPQRKQFQANRDATFVITLEALQPLSPKPEGGGPAPLPSPSPLPPDSPL